MLQNLVHVSTWGAQSKVHGILSSFVGREIADMWIEASSTCAFQLDLKNYSVLLSCFTLRHFNKQCCFPSGLKMEGSHDGVEWNTIQVYLDPNFQIFQQANETKTFLVQTSIFYRFFRIVNFQKNSNNWNFGIGSFEMYGRLNKLKN
jgi:hypothetical protein